MKKQWMKNNLHNCILYLKEKSTRNTVSVQQNQFHKNNMNVISSISCFFEMFSILGKLNTKYNGSFKNQAKQQNKKITKTKFEL